MSVESPLWGIDVSSWNGRMDWGEVKREGFSFGVSKATEGTGYVNPYFTHDEQTAPEAGLLWGAYHFLQSGNVAAQVDHFLSVVGDPDGKLIMVDVEAEDPHTPNVHDVWNFVWGLHDRIGSHPILIYSGYWFWGGYLGNPDVGSLVQQCNVRLWNSIYVSGSGYASSLYRYVPRYWFTNNAFGNRPADILQFTSKALVAGQYLDANAFAGSPADLTALAHKKAAAVR